MISVSIPLRRVEISAQNASVETLGRFLGFSRAPSAARAFRAISATGEAETALASISSVRESSPA